MIHGLVLDSHTHTQQHKFDIKSFIVAHPDGKCGRNSVWASVFVVAESNGVELGTHCVPLVKHHLTKPHKSAYARVDVDAMTTKAVWEAKINRLQLFKE